MSIAAIRGPRRHRRRPLGVTLLAVSSVGVGIAVAALAAYGVYVLRLIPRAFAFLLPYPNALVLVALLIAALQVTIAIGLWSLRPWGHRLAVAFALVGVAFGLATLPLGIFSAMFSLATIWYLYQPNVREAFRAPPRLEFAPR